LLDFQLTISLIIELFNPKSHNLLKLKITFHKMMKALLVVWLAF
jgi:hypothetical protein